MELQRGQGEAARQAASAGLRGTGGGGYTWAGIRRGLVLGWPFVLSSGVTGLAMGVACRQLGMDLTLAFLFSGLVFSGSAQGLVAQLWAGSAPVAAMVLAALAVSARYLVMGGHLRAIFPAVRQRRMVPTLFLLSDASWMVSASEAERGRHDAGLLLGMGITMWLGWVGGTVLGHATTVVPSGPLAAAAAFLPLGFIVAYVPSQWRGLARSAPGWAVAAAVGLGVSLVAALHWAMLAGGAAGTLVALLRGETGEADAR